MRKKILSIVVLFSFVLALYGCNSQEAGRVDTTLPDTTGNGVLEDTTVDETQREEIDLYPTDAPTDPPTVAPTDAPTKPPSDAPTTAPTDAPTESPTTPPTDPPDTTQEPIEEQTTQCGIELPLIPG